jgi:hypothetical protein
VEDFGLEATEDPEDHGGAQRSRVDVLLQEKIEHEVPVWNLEGVLKVVQQGLLGTIRDFVERVASIAGLVVFENVLAEVPKISKVQGGIRATIVLTASSLPRRDEAGARLRLGNTRRNRCRCPGTALQCDKSEL